MTAIIGFEGGLKKRAVAGRRTRSLPRTHQCPHPRRDWLIGAEWRHRRDVSAHGHSFCMMIRRFAARARDNDAP